MPPGTIDGNGTGPQPESASKTEEEADPAKPLISIDKIGYLTLNIPLYKTPEVFARGMVDMCRTEVLKWYVAQGQRRRETEVLAAKTGFQRFRDKLKI